MDEWVEENYTENHRLCYKEMMCFLYCPYFIPSNVHSLAFREQGARKFNQGTFSGVQCTLSFHYFLSIKKERIQEEIKIHQLEFKVLERYSFY